MMNQFAQNPYILQGQQQDISGLSPVFQNIAAQQNNQNMAIQQGQQMAQQAAQSGQESGGGMNPMAMAAMLRGGKSNPKANAKTAMNQYGAGNVYGYGGQGTVPTTTTGMD